MIWAACDKVQSKTVEVFVIRLITSWEGSIHYWTEKSKRITFIRD